MFLAIASNFCSSGLKICRTGILKAKELIPSLLFFKVMSPPRALAMVELQAKPMPVEKFCTNLKFYFILSSKNGSKSIFCLSLDMPRPESIISVSRTKWKLFGMSWLLRVELRHSVLIGRHLSRIKISPPNLLYFTAF